MKTNYINLRVALFVLFVGAVWQGAYSQCASPGDYNGEQVQNTGSETMQSPHNQMNIIVGQSFISTPIYDNSKSLVAGYWSRMLTPPVVGYLSASDGDQPDRIVLNWEMEPNSPEPTQGFNIYRDGILLNSVGAGVYTFQDYNVYPGVYYNYMIRGVNQFDEGPGFEDVGYVSPNGVISGRITTFGGNPVQGATVALTPSSNMSMQFDGASALYIDTVAGNSAPLLDSLFTIAMWVKTDNYSADAMIFDWGKSPTASENMWVEIRTGNQLVVGIADVTGDKELIHTFSSNQNDWHHLAVTYNGYDAVLYIDGEVITSTQIAWSNLNFTNHQIAIGATTNRDSMQNRYDGFVDDVKIMNINQRPSEIRNFMHNTIAKDYPGMVAYWKMDEGQGIKAANITEPARFGRICSADYSVDEPGIESSGISNSAGYYTISDVNYGSGTTFTVTPSKYVAFNYALEFNSVESQYAETPPFGLHDTATIEIWFSPYVFNGVQYLMSSNTGTPFDLYLDGNQLKINIDGTVQTIATIGSTDYHYLAIERVNGDFSIVVDGNTGSPTTFTSSLVNNLPPTTWNLGTSSSNTGYYSGLIDNIIIWNKELSDPTIQIHNTLGLNSIMTVDTAGFKAINDSIDAFIGLNDGVGDSISNEILINGITQRGALYGAGFVDITAHSDGVDHAFNPTSRILTLNSSNTSADNVDFTDVSSVPVSGVFKYENTNCYIQGAQVLVNGQSTIPPTFTNANGQYKVELEPGSTVELSIDYEGHTIYPGFYKVRNIQNPIAGILFEDQTKRNVSGVVAGGKCKLSTVPAGGTATVTLQSLDGCFQRNFVITDANITGEYQFLNVPPLNYSLAVSQHTLTNIFNEFDSQGGKTIDLTENDLEDQNFMYYSDPNVELTPVYFNIDMFGCGQTLLYQNGIYGLDIKVYEVYEGGSCYLDSAGLNIVDNIGIPKTPGFNGLDTLNGSSYFYEFYAGDPNITPPYEKQIDVYANINGRTGSSSVTAIILGKKRRASTFTTGEPQVPISILRDPPGDLSYAYIDQGTEFCMTDFFSYSDDTINGAHGTLHLGPDVTFSIPLTGGYEHQLDVTIDQTWSSSNESNTENSTENTICSTTSEIISTSTELIGDEGDVFIGAGLNLIYGWVDILKINENTCNYVIYQEVFNDVAGIHTFYTYSKYHLENSVIPDLYSLQTRNDSISAQQWEDIIQSNEDLKANATFESNRTFDAGVTYQNSTSIVQDSTITSSYTYQNDGSYALEAGVTFNGLGFVAGTEQTTGYHWNTGSTTNSTTSREVSYVLADDDLGDAFTVNVLEDKVYGTPVFELVAGESSCPHEEGTLPREGVEIFVDNNTYSIKNNVSTDAAAIYTLSLVNTSQSNETMTYAVDVINSSNPDGAVLSINGNVLGTDPVEYTIDPLLNQNATLALEMGANPNIFDFDSIAVVFQSLCDEQISDTVMVEAHFIEPCSSVNISSPLNNWVAVPADSGNIVITVDGYDLSDPDLQEVRVQYRLIGTPSWINIEVIDTADMGPVFTLSNWDIDLGPLADGDYELRAVTSCANGLPPGYSPVVPGIIERNPPEILGTPEPADGILELGDEISVTFTEDINCNVIYYADQINLNNIGLYNMTNGGTLVDANVQCVGDQIVITPNVWLGSMENQTLEVRVTEIEDLVGNVLGEFMPGDSVHTWEFYVNVSPLGWVGANVNEVKEENVPHSFNRTIENTGGTNITYTISTPTYISASSVTGTLAPGAQAVITFTVDNQLSNGLYVDDLILSAPGYADEILPMQVRVVCPDPAWNVNASQYAYNMIFTVALDIEGTTSQDEYDMIAGFINGDVRGVANVQYVSALNKYLAFLSVYGDANDNGENVTFKIWDASDCKLYEQTAETFAFSANGQIGTPLVEDTIHTLDLLANSIPLTQGWNWISFNLELDNDTVTTVLSDLSNPTGGNIKSHTLFAQYNGNLDAWSGPLITLNVEEMYRIQLTSSDTLDYFGTPVNTDSTLIPIVQGWNWIGYLPQGGMSPDHALQSLTPLNGDILKNQYFFAQYVAGIGWIGNLTYMNPPSGYLYQSSNADVLHYPIDASTMVQRSILQQKYNEQEENLRTDFELSNISPNQYSGNMNIIAKAIMSDQNVTAEFDKVYAYINGEVRGIAESIYIDEYNRNVFFLTVFADASETGSTITFNYLNSNSEVLYSVQEQLSYQENAIVGLVDQEQHLTISEVEATGLSDISKATSNGIVVYPNPIDEGTIVRFSATTTNDVRAVVVDNLGRVIASQYISPAIGLNTIEFNKLVNASSISSGVYYLSIEIEGETHRVKLINQ